MEVVIVLMGIVNRRRFSDIARGFLLLSHPIPVLFHTIGVAVFALFAAWPNFLWARIALVIAAHTAMQLSIAFLNDYCDRRLDATAKKNKAIPLGLVRPREALLASLLMIVVMVVLLLPLNPLALLVSCIYLAFGQGYNLGLKSTPLSGVVFALAIPLIPLYAFVGVGHLLPVIFWIVPLGAVLGIALNVASALPDIKEDAAYGAHTFSVVLGLRGSYMLCLLLIFASMILIGILTITRIVPVQTLLVIVTLVLAGAIELVLLFVYNPWKPTQPGKLYFYLVVLICIVLTVGWLLGVLL